MKIHYVYIITNLINGRQYVGSRTCDKNHSDDEYWGSSKFLSEDYKQYGKENFKKEILKNDYENKNDMLEGESLFMHKYNTFVPNGYNRFDPILRKGFHTMGCKASDETKLKMSIAKKGIKFGPKSNEIKIKISNSNKGKHSFVLSEEHKLKIGQSKKGCISPMKDKNHTEFSKLKMSLSRIGEKNAFYGKKHSNESKIKISNSNKGKISLKKGCKLSEEIKQKMSNAAKLRTENKNSMFGKKHSQDTKYKMSLKAKSRPKLICQHCHKQISTSMHNRWHGDNCKNKK